MSITLAKMVLEARTDLATKNAVFDQKVTSGSMKPEERDSRLSIQRSIVKTLELLSIDEDLARTFLRTQAALLKASKEEPAVKAITDGISGSELVGVRTSE